MQTNNITQQKSLAKIIILILILAVIGAGVFFGIYFYKTQKLITNQNNIKKPSNSIPFQTTGGDIQNTYNNNNSLQEYNNTISTSTDTKISRLNKIWNDPVSGFDFVYKDIKTTSTSTASSSTTTTDTITKILKNQEFIYIVDRKTGHIYQKNNSNTDIKRISNKTILKTEKTYIIDKDNFIYRGLYNNDFVINTNHLKIDENDETKTFTKDIDIDSNSLDIKSNKIFYFINKTGDAYITNAINISKKNALKTTLTNLLPEIVNDKITLLTTRASSYYKGYIFTVKNDLKGDNEYILGDKYGLTGKMSPDGQKLLYSEMVNTGYYTFIYDLKTKETISLTQATIPEKCVWNKSSTKIYCAIPSFLPNLDYPDIWYDGEFGFIDNIWSMDIKEGILKPVYALDLIDAIDLKLNNIENTLLFQNKRDLSLWSLSLEN